jgi:hypothetical protein
VQEKEEKLMKNQKKTYDVPKLVVHGTFEEITRGKEPWSGDGKGQWPPGKAIGSGDSMGNPDKS